MQLDVGMGIRVAPHQPGRGAHDRDTQFLVELAQQRIERGLAGFELAAWKLPVTRVGGPGEALREQDPAVGPCQDPDCHAHDGRAAQCVRPDFSARCPA